MAAPTASVLVRVTHRLLIGLGVILAVMSLLFLVFVLYWKRPLPVALVTILFGTLGGFAGIQRRLRSLPESELNLLASSWAYTVLSPGVAGILALMLYMLFLGGLLKGDLFPSFDQVANGNAEGLQRLFEAESNNFADYAKLIFWCFLTGFSEKFITNILGQFDEKAG